MRFKFNEILEAYKRGVKTGIFIAYEMTLWLVEFNLLNGLNVIIEYENGERKEIKTEKNFKQLVREIHREAIKEPEIREILEKIAQE
jgi:hypothetical protein